MRDKLIIIVALAFIAACALLTFDKINSSYSPADYLAPSPAPLVPTATATASATAAEPASSTARPRRTVTVTVTATPPPVTGGEDGQ